MTSTTKFKSALSEAVSKEFVHIKSDENSIEFSFSKQFERRMDKLIKSQRKIFYSFVNTAFKRVAVILVICISMLTVAFSVKAIREPIVNFIKQTYSTFTHYSFVGETVDVITKEYTIKVPDDFKQTNTIKNTGLISTEYTNNSGDVIEFKQMTTKHSAGLFVDNEHGEITTKTINGMEVNYKQWNGTQTLFWTKDGYFFSLDCCGDIDYEVIENIIISLN